MNLLISKAFDRRVGTQLEGLPVPAAIIGI